MLNPSRHPWTRWDAFVQVPDPDSPATNSHRRALSCTNQPADTEYRLRGFTVQDANGYVLFSGRCRRLRFGGSLLVHAETQRRGKAVDDPMQPLSQGGGTEVDEQPNRPRIQIETGRGVHDRPVVSSSSRIPAAPPRLRVSA